MNIIPLILKFCAFVLEALSLALVLETGLDEGAGFNILFISFSSCVSCGFEFGHPIITIPFLF